MVSTSVTKPHFSHFSFQKMALTLEFYNIIISNNIIFSSLTSSICASKLEIQVTLNNPWLKAARSDLQPKATKLDSSFKFNF